MRRRRIVNFNRVRSSYVKAKTAEVDSSALLYLAPGAILLSGLTMMSLGASESISALLTAGIAMGLLNVIFSKGSTGK